MLDLDPDEITDGPLARALAFLAAPIVVQQLVLVGQVIVDIFWLGRLAEGSAAVAAVGLVAPLAGILHLGTYIATTGGQVTVSQHVGADDQVRANRAGFNSVLVVGTIGLAIALVVAVLARPLVGVFDPGQQVATMAAAYLVVLAFANWVGGMSDAVESTFYGWGDSKWPLRVNIVAILTNAILDPFLIFGWAGFPRLGIQGAAYATMIGFGLGGLIGVAVAFSGRSAFSATLDAVQVDTQLVRQIVVVGTPKAGQELGRQAARLVMVAIISFTGGAAALAAYTVGARIATVAFVPAAAIGSANTTVIGQNLGADRPDRAHKATWLGVAVGVFGIGLLGVVQWFFPEFLAHIFVPDMAGQDLFYTVAYLQILAYGYWALGAIYTVEAGFNGASRTSVSMVSTMLQYWGVRVPVAVLLAFGLGMGALGPFWAVTISNVVAALGLTSYFYYSSSDGMLERAADRAAPGD